MRLSLPAAALALLSACSGATVNDTGSASLANATEAAAAANDVSPARIPPPTIAAMADYLPSPGRHEARAMVLAPPPEAVALRDRMARAIMHNQAWYAAYAAQQSEGDPPWHPNLGISEAEYRRFLALTRQIGVRERGRVRLTVTRRADGGLALATNGGAAALNGVILYPEQNRVVTPLGPLTTMIAAGNDEAESPLGRWRGAQWHNGAERAPRIISLSVGRRAAGDLLLYYNYGPSDDEAVILLYPAAAPPTAR